MSKGFQSVHFIQVLETTGQTRNMQTTTDGHLFSHINQLLGGGPNAWWRRRERGRRMRRMTRRERWEEDDEGRKEDDW